MSSKRKEKCYPEKLSHEQTNYCSRISLFFKWYLEAFISMHLPRCLKMCKHTHEMRRYCCGNMNKINSRQRCKGSSMRKFSLTRGCQGLWLYLKGTPIKKMAHLSQKCLGNIIRAKQKEGISRQKIGACHDGIVRRINTNTKNFFWDSTSISS